jgi:hypothetical protein
MATTYDPRNLTWDYYCRLMEEQFAPNQLGNVPEERWREWVDGMNGIGYFVQSAIPDHRMFDTWQEWAAQLVGIMSLDPQ